MSSCEKCWDTPCTCGYSYRDWAPDALEKLIAVLKSADAARGASVVKLALDLRDARAMSDWDKALGIYTPQPGECVCWKCLAGKNVAMMVLCPTCGNKRCPKASDHELACTGSNEPGQPGSNY
jgi:hypothetical protein